MSFKLVSYNFMIYFIASYLFYFFLKILFENKIQSKTKITFILVIQALNFGLINTKWEVYMKLAKSMNIQSYDIEGRPTNAIPIIITIILLIVFIYLYYLIFHCNLLRLFLGVLLVFVLFFILKVLATLIVLKILNVPQKKLLFESNYEIIINSFTIFCLYLFIIFLNKIKISTTNIKRIYIFQLIIVSIINIVVFYIFRYQKEINKNNIYLYLLGVAEVIFSILSIKIIDEIIKYYKKETEWSVRESEYEIQTKYIKSMEELTYKLKAQRHDFNHHIGCIYGLLEGEKMDDAQQYAKKLVLDMQEVNNIINIDNTIIAALLNFKLTIAKEKNIKYNIKSGSLREINIDATDISIILGNAIDNAIEACEYVEDRYIKISMHTKGEYFIINISNSRNMLWLREKGEYNTTKKNSENHGFGLKNIKYVVEKYDGFLEIHEDENIFMLNIALKNDSL